MMVKVMMCGMVMVVGGGGDNCHGNGGFWRWLW